MVPLIAAMSHGKDVLRILRGSYYNRGATCNRCKILYTDGSVDCRYEPYENQVCAFAAGFGNAAGFRNILHKGYVGLSPLSVGTSGSAT